MKIVANIFSYIFHPLFVLVYILGLTLVFNPYLFQVQDEKVRVTFYVYSLMSIVVMPIVAILILKQVNIIKSLSMENRMERIGPLILIGVLYFWLFLNYKNTSSVPIIFTAFLLGGVISVFVAFFINNFTKISLHTVGMGGFVAAIIILKYNLNYNHLDIDIPFLGNYRIDSYFILLVSIVLAGLIGTFRLFLNSHSKDQIYLGYIVGFLAQIIAYKIVF